MTAGAADLKISNQPVTFESNRKRPDSNWLSSIIRVSILLYLVIKVAGKYTYWLQTRKYYKIYLKFVTEHWSFCNSRLERHLAIEKGNTLE